MVRRGIALGGVRPVYTVPILSILHQQRTGPGVTTGPLVDDKYGGVGLLVEGLLGSQLDYCTTVLPVYWKDLDGNHGSFPPIVANVPCNLWGKDILEDM